MTTDFDRFLQAKATPEQKDVFLKAANIIEELGLFNHWLEIENIMALEENIDPFQIVNDIGYVLTTGVKTALNNFSIFSSSLDLELLVDIIESVTLVEEYEDFDTILSITDADESDEEKLAELLALVGGFDFEDYIQALDSVSHRLIARIDSLFSEETEDDESYGVEESMSRTINRLKRFMVDTGMGITSMVEDNKSYLVGEQVAQGMPLGLEPALVYARIEDGLFDLSVERTAQELVAAALASNAETEELATLAKEQAEELFDDANFLHEVNIQINELTQKVFDE